MQLSNRGVSPQPSALQQVNSSFYAGSRSAGRARELDATAGSTAKTIDDQLREHSAFATPCGFSLTFSLDLVIYYSSQPVGSSSRPDYCFRPERNWLDYDDWSSSFSRIRFLASWRWCYKCDQDAAVFLEHNPVSYSSVGPAVVEEMDRDTVICQSEGWSCLFCRHHLRVLA